MATEFLIMDYKYIYEISQGILKYKEGDQMLENTILSPGKFFQRKNPEPITSLVLTTKYTMLMFKVSV